MKKTEIVYCSGPEKDQLEAWQVFYCCYCLLLEAEETEEEAEAGLLEAVVVGGKAAGAGVSAGENGCSVLNCW